MWWKIYFFFAIVLLLISLLSFFSPEPQNILTHIFLIVTYCIALAGLFFYTFRKPIRYQWFWREYFWFYLILDIIYFIYGILPPTAAHVVSFLAVYQDTSYLDSVINTALDIPLLFALYRVSQGKVYTPQISKKTLLKKHLQWGMIQMALWGYSFVLIFYLFVLAFLPMGGDNTKDVSGTFFTTALFAPLLLFWLWILVQYKRYRWNWWRMTLVANALLYSGTIIFSFLLPPTSQSISGGFDIISILQLFILLLSLYVFGKDQFRQPIVKKTEA